MPPRRSEITAVRPLARAGGAIAVTTVGVGVCSATVAGGSDTLEDFSDV